MKKLFKSILCFIYDLLYDSKVRRLERAYGQSIKDKLDLLADIRKILKGDINEKVVTSMYWESFFNAEDAIWEGDYKENPKHFDGLIKKAFQGTKGDNPIIINYDK